MMKSKAALAILAAFLGACASAPEAPQKKMTVTQKGLGSGAEYVACIDCPEPTKKTIHLPPPPAKPLPVKKVEAEPPKPVITTLKVHFRFGMATLDKEGRKELAAAAAEAKRGEVIVVLGRTDPVGGKKFNERLAEKRAETVKQELIAAGIPAASIHAGTHKPCCDGDLKGGAELHRELRRTDVEITIKTTR